MKPRAYSWPEGHWDWYQHLAFKHGVRTGDMVFIGGQVDKTDKGEPLRAYDLPAQTAVVAKHIDTVLRGFGADIAAVTKLVAFYTNDGSVDEQAFIADIGRCFLACLDKELDAPGPTITAVPLPCLALPGMMVEIEAIAMLPTGARSITRHGVNPVGLASLPAPFSHGLRAGVHGWVSAQSPLDANGVVQHAGEPISQTASVMANISKVLDALNLEIGDIVKTGCWFDGDGTTATWRDGALARAKHFQAPGPVVTELPSACLANGETARVDVWAMRGTDGMALARETVIAPDWQWPLELPYSSAIRCEDVVFLSAHLPLDANGTPTQRGRLNDQTAAVMEATKKTLNHFGLGLNHMVKQTSFFLGKANPKDIVTNQTLRSSYYDEPAGASTGVPMPFLALEDVMVSVDTIAMK